MKESPTIYKIIFIHHTKTVELYAEQIYQSDIFGFIEVENFVFSSKSNNIVVNPAEEKLKQDFSNVKRSFIPVQNVLRIDEVNECGDFSVTESKKEDSTKDSLFPFYSKKFSHNNKTPES